MCNITGPLCRNISKLPLSFALKCGSPFSIDCAVLQLDVDEAVTVNIMLDPGFKGDLQSIVVPQKLRVEYTDNPQKDAIDLVARIDYPNLSFESSRVEFGSCLSDTTRRVPVRVTNCSAVDVVYSWAWEADSLQEDVSDGPKGYCPSKPLICLLHLSLLASNLIF